MIRVHFPLILQLCTALRRRELLPHFSTKVIPTEAVYVLSLKLERARVWGIWSLTSSSLIDNFAQRRHLSLLKIGFHKGMVY